MELKNSRKKILVIGDSLCLSRSQPEVVRLSETWPYLLKSNKQFEIIQLGIGGGTIRSLYEQSAYYSASDPDIVIIQSGIVDCAPRALGWLEKEIINSNRLLRFAFHHFFPTNLMRKYRKITYTKTSEFKKLIEELINRFSNSKIIFIGIVPASNEYEELVPGISKNIEEYNNIIETGIRIQQGFFLNTRHIPMKGIMSDYHHLNVIGHEWLSEQISNLISNDK